MPAMAWRAGSKFTLTLAWPPCRAASSVPGRATTPSRLPRRIVASNVGPAPVVIGPPRSHSWSSLSPRYLNVRNRLPYTLSNRNWSSSAALVQVAETQEVVPPRTVTIVVKLSTPGSELPLDATLCQSLGLAKPGLTCLGGTSCTCCMIPHSRRVVKKYAIARAGREHVPRDRRIHGVPMGAGTPAPGQGGLGG